MIASRPTLTSADEFAKRPGPPDGAKEELVRGQIVRTPPPGFAHGVYQVNISAILHNYVHRKKLGRVVVETGVVTERDPDTVRGPDVSYWSKESLPLDEIPSGYPEVPGAAKDPRILRTRSSTCLGHRSEKQIGCRASFSKRLSNDRRNGRARGRRRRAWLSMFGSPDF
jgi:hypothetical protein